MFLKEVYSFQIYLIKYLNLFEQKYSKNYSNFFKHY